MKRRIITIVLVISLCIAMTPFASAEQSERGVLKYEQLISPQYEDAGMFSEGLAPVKKDGKWGYIDASNKLVIGFEYDVANLFSEGYAVVGTFVEDKDTWSDDLVSFVRLGFIDTAGEYTPFRWESDFYGPRYCGPNDGNLYMYLDAEWNQYDFNYDYYFYGGWVYIGGLFDTDGNQFLPHTDEWPQSDLWPLSVPTEGLIPCGTWQYGTEAPCTYVDLNGNVVIDFFEKFEYFDADGYPIDDYSGDGSVKYISYIYPFNQGLAVAWECTFNYHTDEESYKFGFINKSGGWAIYPQYERYLYINSNRYQVFSDSGYATVRNEEKFGAIDKNGKVTIPLEYDRMQSFFEGLAVFENDGKCGYIDVSGSIAIPAQYVAASGFENGCAVVYDGAKAFLIDRYGNSIEGSDLIDPDNYFREYDDGTVVTYSPDEYVIIKEDGSYGFGRISYTPLLPAPSEMDDWAYEEVVAAIEENLVPVRLQNMYRNNITRLDYCELVIRALCTILDTSRDDLVLSTTNKSIGSWVKDYPFSDTAESDVIAAYALELVSGYPEGTFLPYNQISRQEAAVLLWRAAGLLGMDRGLQSESAFDDRGDIPDWAVTQVDYVSSIGVMNGTAPTTFSPNSNYTRQQSFMTIWRLLQAMLEENG